MISSEQASLLRENAALWRQQYDADIDRSTGIVLLDKFTYQVVAWADDFHDGLIGNYAVTTDNRIFYRLRGKSAAAWQPVKVEYL